MKLLTEEFFNDEKFQTITLDNIDSNSSWDTTDNPENWTYVYARSQTTAAPLYTESIFKVHKHKNTTPLTDELSEIMTIEEIYDKMPRTLQQSNTIPSPSGEYITISKIISHTNNDGTITLKTNSNPTTIPVELVINTLSYDKVVTKLINNDL